MAVELVDSLGTPSLPWALLLWEADRGVRSNGANKLKPRLPIPPLFFLPNPTFLPFFLWCDLLLTGSHHSPSVSTIPIPPSKSDAPIHELILLMSAQCTNPVSPYSCPVHLHPFNKSKFSFKCYGCLSWVHQRCSGPVSYTHHHDLWRCTKCQTPSA